MGHSKLNICLLLIIAGTAAVLGSSAEEQPPQMSPKSQDERLPSNLNDYENKVDNITAKRILGGIAATGLTVATSVAAKLKAAVRTVAISVINKSGKKWQAINVYFNAGISDEVMPNAVPSGQTLQYRARKGKSSLSGVSGVIAYYFENKTLAIMFNVPNMLLGLRKNRWNVVFWPGKRNADKKMYKYMNEATPFKGDNGWHDKITNSPYQIKGILSSSQNAILKIEVIA